MHCIALLPCDSGFQGALRACSTPKAWRAALGLLDEMATHRVIPSLRSRHPRWLSYTVVLRDHPDAKFRCEKECVYCIYIYVYIWLVFRQVKVYRLFIRTFAPWGLTSAISSFTSGILERPRSRSQHVTWCDRFVYQDPAWNRSCLSLGGQWRHVLALSGQLGKPDAILQTKARGPATSNYCRVMCSTQNELWSVIVHLLLYAGHKCHKHLNRNVLMGRKNTGCSANNLQVLSEVGKSNWPLALCLLQGWDSKKELSCHVKISCCAKKKMLATFLRSEGRKGFQLFQESTAFAPFYTLQSTARWWHCRTWECDRLCWGRSGRGQEP